MGVNSILYLFQVLWFFIDSFLGLCGGSVHLVQRRVLFTISINFSPIRHFLRVEFRKFRPLLKIELFVVAS